MDLVEARMPVQNRHPWELARATFFNHLILRAIGRDTPVRVLDVGCGDAWFSRQLFLRLPPGSELIGWDIALDDERLRIFSADLPSGMTLTRTEPVGPFDVILCMDVLEHVRDDVGMVLDLAARFLRAGGYLVINVPAWLSLFSKQDLALKHYRRYTPREGRTLVNSAGLSLLKSGGLFHGLLAIRVFQRVFIWTRIEPLDDPESYKHTGEAVGLGAWNASAPVSAVVTAALRAEGAVTRAASASHVQIPGLVCRCRVAEFRRNRAGSECQAGASRRAGAG